MSSAHVSKFGKDERSNKNLHMSLLPVKQLVKKGDKDKFFGNFKTIWLSMEVFNLLGIQNTISYLWIKDLSNTTYAVPNYLTTRRVNLKLQVNF